MGSSFLASELSAALLRAQFERFPEIQAARKNAWNFYHSELEHDETQERVRRPIVPAEATHNAHLYYVLLQSHEQRNRVLKTMRDQGIMSTFHYIPLHSAPGAAGKSRFVGDMLRTNTLSERLLRLPLWADITVADTQRVLEALRGALR